MGRTRLAALVGAAFLLPLSAGAWAADLPEIPPPYTPPVEIGHSWYLRGDIGMTNQSVGSLYNVLYDSATTTVTNISKDFESSPLWSLGIGWRHSDHLRFDLTGEYPRQRHLPRPRHLHRSPRRAPTDGHRRIYRRQIRVDVPGERLLGHRHLAQHHAVRRRRRRRVATTPSRASPTSTRHHRRRRLWRHPLPVEPRLAAHRRPVLSGHARPDGRGGLPLHRSGQCRSPAI